MTQALRIDTLAFTRKLKQAGADEKLAEAIAEGIGAMDTSELATRSDLRAGLAEVKSDILMWMFGAMVVQTALLVALIRVV